MIINFNLIRYIFCDFRPELYKYKVTGTDSLDVAAHLSLLGESMKKLGAQLQSQNPSVIPLHKLSTCQKL